jgi:hypothetical protein
MMGIIVPETCWANNKICNKESLLHLVGIFFPHIHLLYVYVPPVNIWWKPRPGLDKDITKIAPKSVWNPPPAVFPHNY